MSARDELAEVIADHFEVEVTGEYDACAIWATPAEVADAILAAGYTKPRTVMTAEELDSLPDDSVVLDEMDGPLTKVGDWWHSPSDEMRSHSVIVPATVIYSPEES